MSHWSHSGQESLHGNGNFMLQVEAVTTYVLSRLANAWHVHRYHETITVLGTDIVIEEEARLLAINAAKADVPSRVVRIGKEGEHTVIATFVLDNKSSL